MATLFQQFENRFNHWASLDPRMERREREYLSAHAFCGLGDVADQLRPMYGTDLDRKVATLQARHGNKVDLVDFVDPNMSLVHFMRHSILAFRSWLTELEKHRPNRRMFPHAVRESLFAGNDAGWAEYVAHVRKSAPWFDTHEPGEDDDIHPRGGRLATVVRIFFVD
ncbi:hypothetical protein [Paraburkholderia xenovorans]|jgi:hypothetical protein